MEALNSEVAMQSEDRTNGHKLDYYKTKIDVIIWLHMLAVVYTHN